MIKRRRHRELGEYIQENLIHKDWIGQGNLLEKVTFEMRLKNEEWDKWIIGEKPFQAEETTCVRAPKWEKMCHIPGG